MSIKELPNWNRRQVLSEDLDNFFEEVTVPDEGEELDEGAFKPIDFPKDNFKYPDKLAEKIAAGEEILVHSPEGLKKVVIDSQGKSADGWKKFFYNYGKIDAATGKIRIPGSFKTTDGEEIHFTKIEKKPFSGKMTGGVASTQGKEVWAGIGFYIWGGIEKRFLNIRKLVSEKNFESAATEINSLKKFLYQKDIIDESELPEPTDIGAKDAKIVSLVLNGSVTARKKLLAKDADFQGEKIYIVHHSIRKFYDEMMRIGQPSESEVSKPPTTDMVITNVPTLLTIISRIKDGDTSKIKYNNKTGLCNYGAVKFMQVSLKQLEGKSPFGNAKGMIADMTGVTHETGLADLTKMGVLRKAAEEVSPELQEIYSVYEDVLQEGVFSYLSGVASTAYSTMKSAYLAGKELVVDIAKKMADAVKEYTQGISKFLKAGETQAEAKGFALLQQELGRVMMEDKVEAREFKKAPDLFRYVQQLVEAKDKKTLLTYAKAVSSLAEKEKKILIDNIDPSFMKYTAGKKGVIGEVITPEEVVSIMLQTKSN